MEENHELECSSTGALFQVGSGAEWDMARTILVHTPTKAELFMGILHPSAALFECPFDPQRAEQEHRAYIELLQNHGATVHNVKDVLLQDSDKAENLKHLRDLAKNYLQYNTK